MLKEGEALEFVVGNLRYLDGGYGRLPIGGGINLLGAEAGGEEWNWSEVLNEDNVKAMLADPYSNTELLALVSDEDIAAALGITPILIAANPASDVETSFLKIRDLRELI